LGFYLRILYQTACKHVYAVFVSEILADVMIWMKAQIVRRSSAGFRSNGKKGRLRATAVELKKIASALTQSEED